MKDPSRCMSLCRESHLDIMQKRNDDEKVFFVSGSHVGFWLKKKLWILFLLLAFMSSVRTPHIGAPPRAKNADVFYPNNRLSFLQPFSSMLVSSFFSSFPSSLLRPQKHRQHLLSKSSSLMLFSLLPVLPSIHIPPGSSTASSFLVSPSILLTSSLETSPNRSSSSVTTTAPPRTSSSSFSFAFPPSSSSFIGHLHSSLYLLKPFSKNSSVSQGSRGRARSLLHRNFLLFPPPSGASRSVDLSQNSSSPLTRSFHSSHQPPIAHSSLSSSSLSSSSAVFNSQPLSTSRAATLRPPSSASFSFAASREVSDIKEKEKKEEEREEQKEHQRHLEKDKTEEEEENLKESLSTTFEERQGGRHEEGLTELSIPKKREDTSKKLDQISTSSSSSSHSPPPSHTFVSGNTPEKEYFGEARPLTVDEERSTKITEDAEQYQKSGVRTMAWRCSGNSNEDLVNQLRRAGVIRSDRVYEAMRSVDRGDFIKTCPYYDSPQPLGVSTATISAPHMHASALEALKDQLIPGNRALDVGSGSGYLTVCMGYLVGVKGVRKQGKEKEKEEEEEERLHEQEKEGVAVGIDYLPGLVKYSVDKVNAAYPGLLKNPNFRLLVGDGWKGVPEKAPYNAIHVGAAATSIPKALIDQLARGGKMVIPVETTVDGRILVEGEEDTEGPERKQSHGFLGAIFGSYGGGQTFVSVTKDHEGKIHIKKLMGVVYVPLVKQPESGKKQ